jgi:hypothetical protein
LQLNGEGWPAAIMKVLTGSVIRDDITSAFDGEAFLPIDFALPNECLEHAKGPADLIGSVEPLKPTKPLLLKQSASTNTDILLVKTMDMSLRLRTINESLAKGLSKP